MTILEVDAKNKLAYCQVKDPRSAQSFDIWIPFAMLKQYGVTKKDIVAGKIIQQ